MEIEEFRRLMQLYKLAGDENPWLKYWDWKKYADGGEVRDNTYVAPVYKELVFIPATGALKIKNDYQYKYGSKSPYKGGELEIISPEFDILTGVRGLKSITNDLLDNYVGRKLPSNYAYRRTVQQELDDIINTNSFREIPENVVTTGGRTITLPNGKTVTLKKAKGNSHGGKAFSAGDVWKGTTSSGNTSSEIIVGVPGDNAKWMVGKHGNYQGPYNFSDIEKGSAIFVPFDTEGVANISTEGLKYFKPSKYFNNRYIKYANGGIIDEDPPQNTSERPITNFDPKGDPYNPTYGYNPGAGYVSGTDPIGQMYVEGVVLNPVVNRIGKFVAPYFKKAKKSVSNLFSNSMSEVAEYPLADLPIYPMLLQLELNNVKNALATLFKDYAAYLESPQVQQRLNRKYKIGSGILHSASEEYRTPILDFISKVKKVDNNKPYGDFVVDFETPSVHKSTIAATPSGPPTDFRIYDYYVTNATTGKASDAIKDVGAHEASHWLDRRRGGFDTRYNNFMFDRDNIMDFDSWYNYITSNNQIPESILPSNFNYSNLTKEGKEAIREEVKDLYDYITKPTEMRSYLSEITRSNFQKGKTDIFPYNNYEELLQDLGDKNTYVKNILSTFKDKEKAFNVLKRYLWASPSIIMLNKTKEKDKSN